MPVLPRAVDSFIIQSMDSRNRKGDDNHSGLTPVFTSKASVNCRPCTTLHVIFLYDSPMMFVQYSLLREQKREGGKGDREYGERQTEEESE